MSALSLVRERRSLLFTHLRVSALPQEVLGDQRDLPLAAYGKRCGWFAKTPLLFTFFCFGSHILLFAFSPISPSLYQVSSLLDASLCQLPWVQLILHPPQGPLPAPCPESSYFELRVPISLLKEEKVPSCPDSFRMQCPLWDPVLGDTSMPPLHQRDFLSCFIYLIVKGGHHLSIPATSTKELLPQLPHHPSM